MSIYKTCVACFSRTWCGRAWSFSRRCVLIVRGWCGVWPDVVVRWCDCVPMARAWHSLDGGGSNSAFCRAVETRAWRRPGPCPLPTIPFPFGLDRDKISPYPTRPFALGAVGPWRDFGRIRASESFRLLAQVFSAQRDSASRTISLAQLVSMRSHSPAGPPSWTYKATGGPAQSILGDGMACWGHGSVGNA